MKANRPVVEKEVKDASQFVKQNLMGDIEMVGGSANLIWNVQAVNEKGTVLGESEPSSFSVATSNCTHTAVVKSIDCIANVNNQGKSKYRVCVDYKNTGTLGCTLCEILLNHPNNNGGIVIQSNAATTVISNISAIPVTLTAGNIATICFDAEVNNGTTMSFWILGTCHDGNETTAHPDGENTRIDTLVKPCVCDFCKSLEWDSDQPTINIVSNNFNIIHPVWVLIGGGTTVVAAKAEIISFERYINDVCMPCDKSSNTWGNFVSGTWGTTAGIFGNANSGITGNTHHTLYWTTGTSPSFNLNISLPPLSNLDCCCDKFIVNVRYTFTFRDLNGVCKMCSQIMKYEKSKGVCTANPNTSDINNPSK